MEALHSYGLPWASTFVVSAVVLRTATIPALVYADKIFTKNVYAKTLLRRKALEKLSVRFACNVVPDKITGVPTLDIPDEKVRKETEKKIDHIIFDYTNDHGIRSSRVLNIKALVGTGWFFSAFAMRNILVEDFPPVIDGVLWLQNFAAPDPYYILPIAVGVLGYLNNYAQRIAMSQQGIVWDVFYGGLMIAFACILSTQPAVAPLFFATVTSTGLVQALMMRHPAVRKLLGIPPLPTDTRTPIRALLRSSLTGKPA